MLFFDSLHQVIAFIVEIGEESPSTIPPQGGKAIAANGRHSSDMCRNERDT